MLLVRDELEYHRDTGENVYKARPRSRFDDSELICIFVDVLWRMRTLQMVSAAFDGQRFEDDVKLIDCTSVGPHLLSAMILCNASPKESSDRRSSRMVKDCRSLSPLAPHTAQLYYVPTRWG